MIDAIKNHPVRASVLAVSGTVLTIALVKEVIKLHRTNEVVIESHKLIENIQLANAN